MPPRDTCRFWKGLADPCNGSTFVEVYYDNINAQRKAGDTLNDNYQTDKIVGRNPKPRRSETPVRRFGHDDRLAIKLVRPGHSAKKTRLATDFVSAYCCSCIAPCWPHLPMLRQ